MALKVLLIAFGIACLAHGCVTLGARLLRKRRMARATARFKRTFRVIPGGK